MLRPNFRKPPASICPLSIGLNLDSGENLQCVERGLTAVQTGRPTLGGLRAYRDGGEGPPSTRFRTVAVRIAPAFRERFAVRIPCTRGGSFRRSKIVRHYRALEWPIPVCGSHFAGLSAVCGRMRPKVSGREIPFPKMVFALGSSRPTGGRHRRLSPRMPGRKAAHSQMALPGAGRGAEGGIKFSAGAKTAEQQWSVPHGIAMARLRRARRRRRSKRRPSSSTSARPVWPSVARVIIASVIRPIDPTAQTCTPTA